jgi:cytochrome P450
MLHKMASLQDVQQTYRWFEEMRETQPVWRDEESGFWHVFRYQDVYRVTTDYSTFSSEVRPRPLPRREDGTRPFGRSLIAMDPPQHRKYRDLISPSFTPHALARLSGRIATITQELLDEVKPKGHMDLATDLAYPLPTIVIAEMLGVPTSDRPLFRRWADGLLSRQLSDAEFFKEGNREEISNSFQEMSDYFRAMLEERKRQPREDLMSDLLAAEVDGERLSMEDTISFCVLLLLAGHVTTTNLLSQAIRCFDEHPLVMAQLRRQPELMLGAIEEVLRYASPVWRLVRGTKTEVTLHGVTIPAGAMIFAWLASANRDGEQFSEPEYFDITRHPNKHLAFGHGIHFCVGAPLSRLETSIALPMILAQLPELRRVPGQSGTLFEGRALFGFRHLPVVFTPAQAA